METKTQETAAQILQAKKIAEDAGNPLLVEHLNTAHGYVLGAMREECLMNLQMAQDAAGDLADASARRDCLRLIENATAAITA